MENNLKNKKIFVTGGAGFIGSHIVESLVKRGAIVTVYDNFSTGSIENLKSVIKEIKIIKGDILDYKKLEKVMKGHDIVSHQAAQLEITKSMEDPIEDLTINTIGSLNVFKAAVKNNVKKIINASSAGVYGQARYIPQDENHPTIPNWCYGVSKLSVEKYANIFYELYKIPIISLRYSIVYGPREWYGRVLTIFLKRAMDGKPLIVFGDGNQIRDFIFVEDLVELHNICLEKKDLTNEIFNVCSGRGVTINQLAQIVLKITGRKDLKIIHENVSEGQKSKYFNRKRLPLELKKMVMSYKKAEKILGWKPKTSLEKGLLLEYKWLKENRHIWKKMSY